MRAAIVAQLVAQGNNVDRNTLFYGMLHALPACVPPASTPLAPLLAPRDRDSELGLTHLKRTPCGLQEHLGSLTRGHGSHAGDTRAFKLYWRWKSRKKPGRPPISRVMAGRPGLRLDFHRQ